MERRVQRRVILRRLALRRLAVDIAAVPDLSVDQMAVWRLFGGAIALQAAKGVAVGRIQDRERGLAERARAVIKLGVCVDREIANDPAGCFGRSFRAIGAHGRKDCSVRRQWQHRKGYQVRESGHCDTRQLRNGTAQSSQLASPTHHGTLSQHPVLGQRHVIMLLLGEETRIAILGSSLCFSRKVRRGAEMRTPTFGGINLSLHLSPRQLPIRIIDGLQYFPRA